MKKTHKKYERQICQALQLACEEIMHNVQGFSWLTHTVNFQRFPESLKVTCIFNLKQDMQHVLQSDAALNNIHTPIIQQLRQVGIHLHKQQIMLDNEEACEADHQGNWVLRLQQH